ncbi:MAG TPA: ATP-binding protein [Thermoanaerobaculia bacterium]|nr:ATP-binding protein [Thermoanaerobaculia bacterium]
MPGIHQDPLQNAHAPERRHDRVTLLARILETFTGTLDLEEVLSRIVTTTLNELNVDRAWMLHPVSLTAEYATVSFEATRPGYPGAFEMGIPVPLEGSRALIRKAIDTGEVVVTHEGDADLDPLLAEQFRIRGQLFQVLHPSDSEVWGFGLHQCSHARLWTTDDVALFAEIGRYATIALNNALLHRRAVVEASKVTAIIDQIPEAAAIYGADGKLERVNAAARTQPITLFQADEESRAVLLEMDGSEPRPDNLPSRRALNGETIKSDYQIRDTRTGDTRIVQVKAAPVRDGSGAVVGSVVISADITEERLKLERDIRRRGRADCLANLGLDLFSTSLSPVNLDESARRVGDALKANVQIHLYHQPSDQLLLVGSAFRDAAGRAFGDCLRRKPYRSGEGLAGAVFEIGKPLLFSEIRGDAITEFARDYDEKKLKGAMREQSLIACPVDSYGERIGALVISSLEDASVLNAEDLEFAQSVAARIGAAVHIHRLNRISNEGQRAADELARREVTARNSLEAVLDSAPFGIAVVSADELRFELTNPPWIEYATRFGRITSDTRVIGRRVAEVVPDLERALRQAAESGETRIDEALEIQRGMESWYVSRIIAPVRGRYSGATQSLTILVQDVTEQVRAKREIEALAQIMEERSARLASILGSMTDALLVYDASGRVVDVNPAALAMLGIGSRSEAVTRGSLQDLQLRYPDGKAIPPDEIPYVRALRGETVPDFLTVGRHLLTGKDLDLSIAVAPIESGGIVGAVLVIRDITALQELDRKKDEFLSVASHELRTPLTTIKGYTQLLAQTVNQLGPDERMTYLSAVLGEIDRMMGLITELLDVSRIETRKLELEPRRVPWVAFLEGRISAFQIQYPDRRIEFESDSSDVTLEVDADRMRQVVDNLISNAMKYSPDGSPIRVTVSLENGHVETSVIDRGIGIPRDEIPRLFERFHRARNVSSRYYGGLGLGLYIAKAIVEAHDGSIVVQSDEGEGSIFTVRLPSS